MLASTAQHLLLRLSDRITESQKGWGGQGPLVHLVQFLPKQGHTQQGTQAHIQAAFGDLQRDSIASGEALQTFQHLCVVKVFAEVQRKPQFVSTASCRGSGHHWKEPGPILSAPSLQLYIDVNEIPLGCFFSRLNRCRYLSLSWCSSLFITLVALHWTLSSMSVSFSYWGAQKWTQHSGCDLTSTKAAVTYSELEKDSQISLLYREQPQF